MKINRIKAIAKKEFIQISRDPFSLAVAFITPLMLLLMFGFALTFDINNLQTVVYDHDKTSASRDLIKVFIDSGYFQIVSYLDSNADIDKYIDSGKARVAINIPANFSKKISADENVQVGVILDGSDSNTAAIVQGYISAITETYTAKLRGRHIIPLIDARSRVWYNPELRSKNFIVPGLIVLIMSVIIALLTSLTIAKEWETGTMEQLISTPIKTPELLIGKLIPYYTIGFVDFIISVLLGVFLFHVPLNGSIPLLLILSGIFLFGGICQGIAISVISHGSQRVATQIAMLSTFLPAYLLSGFIFSISNMPKILQLITYLVPARYFVTILKGIFLKGNDLRILWIESLLLTIFAGFIFRSAYKKFKKKIP
ncbi:ABC transporter permease [Candidatus Desantisbacteria bacterium]|nr:ABC transporter permease [Candidatus Desantisbacteria bacterium]